MSQNRRDRPTPKQVKCVLQEALLRNYPNPHSKGCRGPEILREMAAQESPDEHPFWNEHVSECSPCYREFLDFRHEIVGRESPHRRTTRLAIAATIVLIIAAGSIYLSRRADRTSTPPTALRIPDWRLAEETRNRGSELLTPPRRYPTMLSGLSRRIVLWR
jgi:hypothetical protein